jgi:hypothetical protein
MATTKTEQESTIHWDQEERVLHLYTAHRATASKWTKLGYPVECDGRTPAGKPRSWRSTAPIEALRLRRLVDGQVVSRPRGRSFGPEHRKSAAAQHGSAPQGSRGPGRQHLPGQTAN